MDVVSACPLRVASLLWQPRPGVFVLTVVCKATYTLLPAESPLAHEQDPPNEVDDHWNDDERRSLHGASDLVPFKPRADVFLVGHAHAPRNQPASSLIARMIVGEVDKSIEVHADRVWTQDGQLREGARFTKMPLRYERAGGGLMTSNPVGMRPDTQPDRYGQVPVPNLQPPGHHVARPEEAVPPIGLGPIAPAWPGRAAKLYGNASGWDYRTGLARPLPQGIDPGFFNAAPPDQQTGELRGNERIVLEHLHPEHVRLVTSLSGIAPRAAVERAGMAAQALPLCCDTLSIDMDRGVCNLVWRGQMVLARPDEAGCVVITTVGEGRDAAVETIVGGMRTATALPFAAEQAARQKDDATSTMPGVFAGTAIAALPFREASPWEGAPVIAIATEGAGGRTEDDGTGTILALRGGSRDALPFVKSALPAGTSGMMAPPVMTPPLIPPPPPPSAPMLVPASVMPWAPMLSRGDHAGSISTPLRPTAVPVAAEPPPMIGPLATPEMVANQPTPEHEVSPAPAPPVAPVAPTKQALPRDVVPIEECAAIAASMARRTKDRVKILEENELTQSTWDELARHWAEEIRRATRRGKTGLLDTYDRAYVARLEEERGRIQVEEYARLVVAGERGDMGEVLAEMTLPSEATMCIERVWLKKLAGDAELGRRVRHAVKAAREA